MHAKMNIEDQLFGLDAERDWEDLGGGVKRKIMCYNAELMIAKVQFEKGSIGAVHNHPHVQTSYVSRGKFKYTIAQEERILTTGDTCIIPSMLMHGCECIEAGELIDSFTPFRADFVQ